MASCAAQRQKWLRSRGDAELAACNILASHRKPIAWVTGRLKQTNGARNVARYWFCTPRSNLDSWRFNEVENCEILGLELCHFPRGLHAALVTRDIIPSEMAVRVIGSWYYTSELPADEAATLRAAMVSKDCESLARRGRGRLFHPVDAWLLGPAASTFRRVPGPPRIGGGKRPALPGRRPPA